MTESPRSSVVGLAVDLEAHAALEHEADLAAARLVHAIAAGNGRAAAELVLGDRDALAREVGCDERHVVLAAPGRRPLAGAHDGGGRRLVEAQQLGEREVEAVRDPARGRERGRRLAALDL